MNPARIIIEMNDKGVCTIEAKCEAMQATFMCKSLENFCSELISGKFKSLEPNVDLKKSEQEETIK